MQQHELKPHASRLKKRQPVGRGACSGAGNYSGRGMKGQKARTGRKLRFGFEGGQTPLIMRMPKLRGFKPKKQSRLATVNLLTLSRSYPEGGELSPERLANDGLIPADMELKVIGKQFAAGFSAKFKIKAQQFSPGAKETITKTGGTVEELKSIRPVKQEKKKIADTAEATKEESTE